MGYIAEKLGEAATNLTFGAMLSMFSDYINSKKEKEEK